MGLDLGKLIGAYRRCHALEARELAMATDLLAEMLSDERCSVFLALAGPLVAAGLRRIIAQLIRRGFIKALVLSGASVVHDIIEALGFRHRWGEVISDEKARQAGLGRICNIYIEQRAFERLEKFVRDVTPELKDICCVSELLHHLGGRLRDEGSIVHSAYLADVRVFSPGLADSMVTFHLMSSPLQLDAIADFSKLVDMVFESERVGVIVLGGGLPKHHTLMACILRGGADIAIQVTLDRPEGGSLSGAPLGEAISWGKIKEGGKFASVWGDATVLFPLILGGAFLKLGWSA